MDFEDNHGIESEDQFWDELDKTVSQECETNSHIDDALRSYLTLVAGSRGTVIGTQYDLGRCSYKLASSPLFTQHADYIRHQFVYSLLQEDDRSTLVVTTSFLLADARTTERTFEVLNEEGAFPKLAELITGLKDEDEEALHRLLMELLYEMSRIQKISLDNLAHIGDELVMCLFDIIERVSNDVNDPYHYPVIRVLLVLNEQFMVAAHDPGHSKLSVPLTNKVVKVLSAHGSKYKTFGENIILLLNREDETSLQLLTLKLLYLLFTTPPTYEYFYTNDLRVLVDILIRNLLDLPEEAAALRHTYLRVLYPLLEHTQLQQPPHYKRDEIRKLLIVLGGGQVLEEQEDGTTLRHWAHFDEIDETTKRLVRRCQGVSWLIEPETEPTEEAQSPTSDLPSEPASPVSPSKPQPPALPAPRKLTKRSSSKGSTLTIGQFLTPQLEHARQSSLSMMEVAAQTEKPGVITPSRNPSLKHSLRTTIIHKKEKPPPPRARRSGWARMKMERNATEDEVARVSLGDSPTITAPQQEETRYDSEIAPGEGKEEDLTQPAAQQVPPAPPLTTKPVSPTSHSKKPPPAPKARRWGRNKRASQEEELVQAREPGKFDARLPSIKPTTSPTSVEQSPFSPPAEKTLSPLLPEGPVSSVSEALEEAQREAVSGVTETFQRVKLAEEEEQTQPESPGDERHLARLPSIEERPTIIIEEVAPARHVILTPPNPAPPRPVPGPKWELERSPFLSDAELEDESDKEEEDTLKTS